jgi:hypothetical protein
MATDTLNTKLQTKEGVLFLLYLLIVSYCLIDEKRKGLGYYEKNKVEDPIVAIEVTIFIATT